MKLKEIIAIQFLLHEKDPLIYQKWPVSRKRPIRG